MQITLVLGVRSSGKSKYIKNVATHDCKVFQIENDCNLENLQKKVAQLLIDHPLTDELFLELNITSINFEIIENIFKRFENIQIVLVVCPFYIAAHRSITLDCLLNNLHPNKVVEKHFSFQFLNSYLENLLKMNSKILVYNSFSDNFVDRQEFFEHFNYIPSLPDLQKICFDENYQAIEVDGERLGGDTEFEITSQIILENYDFKDKLVLDCGCNFGGIAHTIAMSCPTAFVYGLDNHQVRSDVSSIISIKKNLERRTFFAEFDITSLPFKNSISVILCLNVLHHLSEDAEDLFFKLLSSESDIILELELSKSFSGGFDYSEEIELSNGLNGRFWRPSVQYVIRNATDNGYSITVVPSVRRNRKIFILRKDGLGNVQTVTSLKYLLIKFLRRSRGLYKRLAKFT